MEIAYAVHGAKPKINSSRSFLFERKRRLCLTGGTWYFDEMDIRIGTRCKHTTRFESFSGSFSTLPKDQKERFTGLKDLCREVLFSRV